MLRALCLALIILVVPLGRSFADPAVDPNANAALKYWQAFATMPHLTDAEQNKLISECLTMPLDAQVRELVDRAEYSLQMMHRGASLEQCDWGIGPEEGVYARLPHGPAARVLASIACLRARLRFEEGKNAQAVSDILAGLAMARHVSQDGVLILLFLGNAIEHRMNEALALYLPKLGPEQILDLKLQLAKLPPGGTPAKSMRIEEKRSLDWLIHTVKDTKDHEKLLAQLSPLFIREGPGRSTPKEMQAKAQEFIKACDGTADGVVQFAEKIRPAYARIAAKLDLPLEEFEKEFQLEEKKQAGNPVFDVIFPAMRKVRQQQARTDVRRALLTAAIAVRLEGQGALKNYTDPVDGKPFDYIPIAGGFQLQSNLKTPEGKATSLTVGQPGQ